MSMKIVQTAGRELLGDFAPEFAHYNDDVLFGENWNNEDIDIKTRCLLTVVALMASGITDSSLKYHIINAKKHGVSKAEFVAAVTHVTFYAGWPKAWAVFNMAKEVWAEDKAEKADTEIPDNLSAFPVGEPNPYGQFFTGQSYLAMLTTEQIPTFNVTFEPGCRNNWHIHHAKSGGGQLLICVSGRGWYQEWGKDARELHPGDIVNIPVGVKHWHGAAADSWFQHVAQEIPGEETSNEWLEPVTDEEYGKLK